MLTAYLIAELLETLRRSRLHRNHLHVDRLLNSGIIGNLR
jgi:hypothetical protein